MVKVKQLPRRQRVRKALLFVSLLLFPVTLYYFSPAIILQAASEGIVNASFIVFGLMFLSALVVGRLWCGWACPAGALQEFGQPLEAGSTGSSGASGSRGSASSSPWPSEPAATGAWTPCTSWRLV